MARLTGLAALCVMALGLAACGGDKTASEQPTTLRVGYGYGFDAGDTGDRVALDRLAAADGIKVRYRETGGSANAIVALVRGDVDIANLSYLRTIAAVRQGAPVEAVLGSNMASEFLFVGRPEITSPAKLAGKRVAFSEAGADGEAMEKLVLQRAHVPLDDVHFSSLPDSPVRAAALGAGRVDATEIEYIDYHRLRTRLPGLTMLGSSAEFKPRAPQTVWAVSRSWAKAHPAFLKQIVDGLLDGYEFDYSPAGRAAWIRKAKATVLAGDPASLVSDTYDYYRRVEFWPRASEPMTPAMHHRLLAYWRSTGQIDGDIAFAKIWDPSLWLNAGG